MNYPTCLHHGAAGDVTGSCHRYLASADAHVLVDCGFFQGQDVTAPDHHSQHRVEFDLTVIRALVVTHVHIDHVGRIPYLFAAGFRGPIICSEPGIFWVRRTWSSTATTKQKTAVNGANACAASLSMRCRIRAP